MSRNRNRGRGRNRAAAGSASGNRAQPSGNGEARSTSGDRQGQAQQGKGRRRRRGGQRPKPSTDFWGDVAELPEPQTGLRISEQPDAVVRSLGPPPLPGREQIAGHYFLAIYQRAVMTAGALAASGGLIATEELSKEFESSDD